MGRAAVGAVNCYLSLFDAPKASDLSGVNNPDYESMTPAQRKREKAKARKAAKKAADEKEAEAALRAAREEKEASTDAKKKKKPAIDRPVDDDPLGEKLLEADPLVEAQRLVTVLTRFAPRHINTQLVAFDTAMRRNKPLLALRALVMGVRCTGHEGLGSSELVVRLADFAVKYQSDKTPVHEAVRQTIDAEVTALVGGTSVEEYLTKYATDVNTQKSLSKSLAAARALFQIAWSDRVEAAVSLVIDGGLDRLDVSVANCAEAYEFLSKDLKASEQAEAWRQRCLVKYPRATALGASEDMPYDSSPSPDIQAAP